MAIKTIRPIPKSVQSNNPQILRAQVTTIRKHKEKLERGLPNLELYQTELHPGSRWVRESLSKLSLDYIVHCTASALRHEQLVRLGGRNEIPFLIDHKSGVKLYGAWAITSYLEKQYGKPENLFERLKSHSRQLSWAVLDPIEKAKRLKSDWLDTWQSLKLAFRSIKESTQPPSAETQAGSTREKKAA